MVGRIAFWFNVGATISGIAMGTPGLAVLNLLTAAFLLSVYWDEWK